MKTLWHLLEYGLVRLLLALLQLLPLPLVLFLARQAADLIFLLWTKRRRIAVDNILRSGLVADVPAARRMARQAFRAFTYMVVETMLVRNRITSQNWREYVTLHLSPESEKLLRQEGLGLIVASAHLGNWEVAARAVSQIKPICVIYRPFNNPWLDRYTTRNRSGRGLRLVSRKDAQPMRFLQALTGGEVVAIMIDQHASKGRVAVDFFGRRAWTTKSVAMMHLTTRAPLVVACAIRTGPLRYEVHTAGPVTCPRTGHREEDARRVTQALTDEIEKIIRRYPEQYMWGHRRWRA